MVSIPKHDTWQPPTPDSSRIPHHFAPNLPVDHLVLLPPPLVAPTERIEKRRRSLSVSSDDQSRGPVPPTQRAFHPSHLLPPLAVSPKSEPNHEDQEDPSSRPEGSKTVMGWEQEYTQRLRRSAAIVANRKIPRMPSPFELDSDDPAFSPPPPLPGLTGSGSIKRSNSMVKSRRTSSDSIGGSTAMVGSGSTGGGGGSSSKRKVSHSLIERRRREKINDCLSTLKETVPILKEEGERKIAKAKERGRRRGALATTDDNGERGGLHKLEILQGTIEYIAQLRARIEELETRTAPISTSRHSEAASAVTPGSTSTSTWSASPDPVAPAIHAPLLATTDSFESSSASTTTAATVAEELEELVASKEDADRAANMLLYFSTSPELRPVLF
ncbi:uncharacterized protein JCM15063_002382 [Sporobolomyces koalae]|uniref:uncharacterized protein n=1 Tax=Sporobolomyces koalae TaxID=500713 RepID=UPI0031773F41